ncbi:MAG TPA: hemerythrin domain-containing protein [Sphingomonas sp.]|uniref:hemerythrin domain-containing protein n=1 Tax=Sphingomonas sp. TaxID=28214 RepID=UPI002CED0720|nr:hemerythrin domain-containing protein [Sphingomonas sp.]HMI17939.1 hemerythrin domain-containing protein [Sphingomonas sp.]
MATTTTRARTATAAKRSATAQAEARDGDGRFTKSSAPRKKSTRSDHPGTGAMLAAGAAGLAVGLAANVARKFAVQSPTYFAGEWDEALTAEHALTLKVFDTIEATTEKNTTKRNLLLMNLKHMLTKHALEEENSVYPAMRDAGEAEAADHLNNDHGYVKQYLYDLTVTAKDSPAWIAKIRQFRADIEKHMREEETTLFPQLKAKLTPEQNKALTSAMNKEGLKIA